MVDAIAMMAPEAAEAEAEAAFAEWGADYVYLIKQSTVQVTEAEGISLEGD